MNADLKKKSGLVGELRTLWAKTRTLDFAVVFVLVMVAVISTINYYYGSRKFITHLLGDVFEDRMTLRFWAAVARNFVRFAYSFALPVLLIKWPIRAKLRDYGLGAGDWRFGLKIATIFIAVMLPILWVASASKGFVRTYPSCPGVKTDWGLFAIYAASYIFYMAGWEFLWRGFMLFGLREKLGYYAILVQMIPFTLLHFGKPFAESLSAVIAGVALGVLALRSRSFWYCALVHTVVIISINLLAVLRFRAQAYGIGLDDLARVLAALI